MASQLALPASMPMPPACCVQQSILGDRSELSLAAALAGTDPAAALTAASALVRADLLRYENPIEFIHPVVRSSVLESMSADESTRAHRRAAELLLDRGALPEQAATYLVRAIPSGDQFVVATLRHAAERSLAQGAPEAAVGYLRRALDEPPPDGARADVLGDLGIAETHSDVIGAANRLAASLGDFDDVGIRPDVVLAYARMLTIIPSGGREIGRVAAATERRVGADDANCGEHIAAFLIITCQFDPAQERDRSGADGSASTGKRSVPGPAQRMRHRGGPSGRESPALDRARAEGADERVDRNGRPLRARERGRVSRARWRGR